MKLKFLGASGTVTGSKYLLTAGDTRILGDELDWQGEVPDYLDEVDL